MFFRRSDHLVHNPANKLGGDDNNKNGFLKTGVNLNYLVFLFEFMVSVAFCDCY